MVALPDNLAIDSSLHWMFNNVIGIVVWYMDILRPTGCRLFFCSIMYSAAAYSVPSLFSLRVFSTFFQFQRIRISRTWKNSRIKRALKHYRSFLVFYNDWQWEIKNTKTTCIGNKKRILFGNCITSRIFLKIRTFAISYVKMAWIFNSWVVNVAWSTA